MSECNAQPLPELAFAEPWHAQVFAVTVALNEAGRFEWSEWANRFSKMLKRNGLSKELNGGNDYFHAWLETLEAFLAEMGDANPSDVAAVSLDWEKAYLTTPHGEPVHLSNG